MPTRYPRPKQVVQSHLQCTFTRAVDPHTLQLLGRPNTYLKPSSRREPTPVYVQRVTILLRHVRYSSEMENVPTDPLLLLLPFAASCQRHGCPRINKGNSQFSSNSTTHPFADSTSDFILLTYVTVYLCDTFSLITHFDKNDWEIPTPRSIHSRRSDISRPSFTIVCLTQLTRGQRTRSPGIFPPPEK